jgi:hypothetical protein
VHRVVRDDYSPQMPYEIACQSGNGPFWMSRQDVMIANGWDFNPHVDRAAAQLSSTLARVVQELTSSWATP